METRAQKRFRLEQEENEQNKKTKQEIENIVNEIQMEDPEIISELENINKNLQKEKKFEKFISISELEDELEDINKNFNSKDDYNSKEFKNIELKYGSICTIM